MEYLGYNADGSRGDNWGNANEDHYNNDKALYSIVVSGKGGEPATHKYALYPDGNRTNTMAIDKFHANGTMQDPDRFELGDQGGRGGGQFWHGPKSMAAERLILQEALKEGEFGISDVFYLPTLSATAVQGVVPIYEPSCGIVPSRVVDGKCQGQTQKRIGAFFIGINLGLISLFLSEMSLKGGYMFYIERKSGLIIGTSNKDMPLKKTITNPDGSTKDVAVPAMEAQDPQLVKRVEWLLNEREGKKITWKDVKEGHGQATIDGEENFMYITVYREFQVDWIGILSIPWDSVMEDIERQKWQTMAYGLGVALGIKLTIQALVILISMRLWKTMVYPALCRAGKKDLEAAGVSA